MHFRYIKEWYTRYERYLIPGSLLLGLVSDFFLFQYINITVAFSLLAVYLVLSALVIAFMHAYDAGRMHLSFLRYVRLFIPLVLQYSLGALLSGFLIFYWFGGIFSASWPFIVIIMFLMVSNDLLKTYYLRLPVQVGVYFFILFSYSVLVLPVLLGTIEAWIFVAGGILSLAVMCLYLYLLSGPIPLIYRKRRLLGWIIAGIFVSMNILYFTNMIPPVPLALREAGVYHFVERQSSGEYFVLKEDKTFIERILHGKDILILPGGSVYVFSSVFAPAELSAHIVHNWQYYNESEGVWQTRSRVQFPIVGGRDEGYRGFSRVSNATEGKWRVNVETSRGQVVGRMNFTVSHASEKPDLVSERL